MIEKMLGGLATRIVKGLSSRTEALLIFSLVACAIVLIWLGVNPWLACGFPIACYLLYIYRAERSDRHDVDMKELEISQLQVQNEAKLEQIKAKKVAQRKNSVSVPANNGAQGSNKKNIVK